jgi:ABC-type Na+ efflux pump permease subunit
MLLAGGLQSTSLDMPTLSLVAVCIAGLLGLFLIIDWMQQRNVRALAWWGSAYLIGASAMASVCSRVGAYCHSPRSLAQLSGWVSPAFRA